MIVISDIHGCYETFKALLKKLPHNNVCILGDMIDRGQDSFKVVDYIKSNNIKCVIGNHEDMAIQVSESEENSKHDLIQWWYGNGGDITVKSYKNHSVDISEHVKWFKTLPLYIEYTNKKGQHYILSHSNINFAWNKKDSMPTEFRGWCLWSRDFDKSMYGSSKIGKSKNVIGHTPQKSVKADEDLIFIDTGCLYGKHGYGNLSAYDLETGEIYTQRYVLDNIK